MKSGRWAAGALGIIACWLLSSPSRAEQPTTLESHPTALPTATIRLSDWGLSRADEIAYVELGLVGRSGDTRLVIYDVRAVVPRRRERTVRWQPPSLSDGVFLVDDFAHGNRNRLNGYSSAFAREPSSGDLDVEKLADGRSALTFKYRRAVAGFAGFWIHLFDFKSHEPVFLDVRSVPLLTFQVRGFRGDETVLLKAADREWEAKGDAVAIGHLSEFLSAKRIDTAWQQAWVPLERLPVQLDRRVMASLVFEIEGQGESGIQIRDVALAQSREVVIPQSPPTKVHRNPLRKGLWVWETLAIADSDTALQDFISFCKVERVTDAFLQIPAAGPARLRHVVSALHEAGIQVDALDGAPRFALREHHDEVLASLRTIVEYNRTASGVERYDGVRYDNEPYLLAGFAGVEKHSILRQYLELIVRTRAMTKAAGMRFGIDIPFWFDSDDRFFEPVAVLDGRPVTEHIIDNVDNVTIMDYRTVAHGPDGVIENARLELAYAATRGTQVFVGLETVSLPDETMQAFSPAGAGARVVLRAIGDDEVALRWIPVHAWPPVSESVSGQPTFRVLGQIHQADVPASKITFDRWSPARLDRVMQQASDELGRSPSFVGFAIHSYESYRPWLARHR